MIVDFKGFNIGVMVIMKMKMKMWIMDISLGVIVCSWIDIF